MGARIRKRGMVVCAAMHPAHCGDIYLTDQQLYDLSEAGELVATPTHLHKSTCNGTDCKSWLIGASGSPVCGDGLWLRRNDALAAEEQRALA